MAEIYLDRVFPCAAALEYQNWPPNTDVLFDLVGNGNFTFTHSGAEAIASVHWTVFLEVARKTGKCHFITSAGEDAAMLQSLKRLEELGCFVKIAPLNEEGQIDVAKLKELISPRTALISISMAHALTGVIQPIEEIAALGVPVHVDASYALGKVVNPFQHVDYLTFAGTPIHSIPGSGGIFSKGLVIPIVPAKEPDPSALHALCKAALHLQLSMDTMNLEVARLRDRLESPFKSLFQNSLRLPNIALLDFPGIHQEMLHYALQRKNLFATFGGHQHPHLRNISPSALSFTLSRYTTQDEIDRAIVILQETVASLKPLAEDLIV